MPVTSTVLSMNEELDANPELVNNDPYGAGWLIRVKLNNPEDIETLLSADEYKELVSA